MTRKHKFEVGDLIVLKKDVGVYKYPDVFLAEQDVRDIVATRTRITNVGCVDRHSAQAFHELKAGTAGVVKSYENVFMLDYDVVYDGPRFEEQVNGRQNDPNVVIYQAHKWNKKAYVNAKGRQHLVAVIDGMLVAFPAGGKLFESPDSALSRVTATVTYEIGYRYDNVLESDLQAEIDRVMHALGRSSKVGSARVVSVERVDRDGNVKKDDR